MSCGSTDANGKQTEQQKTNTNQIQPQSTCSIDKDPFLCQKQACLSAGATYDQDAKVCSCSKGEMFYAKDVGSCVKGNEFDSGILYKWSDKFQMPVKIYGANLDDIKSDLPSFSPAFGSTMGRVVLFKSVDDYRVVVGNDNSLQSILQITVDAPNLNLDFDPNSGVQNPTVQFDILSYFLPTNLNLKLYDNNLNGLLTKAIEKMNIFEPGEVVSYSDLGCAEICEATQEMFTTDDYAILHRKVYSRGNPVNDVLKFYNLRTNHFDLQVALFNQKISHYVIRNSDLGYQTYSNAGELIATDIETLKKENKRLQTTDVGKQAPVLIFESQLPQDVDAIAAVGPFPDSSYYGWFTASDRMSFLDEASSAGNANHAKIVTSLSSDHFQQVLLPMPMGSIFSGDFEKAMTRFPYKHLVGNLSLSTSFSGAQKYNNHFVHIVENSLDKILWVQGAGNTGRELLHQNQEIASQTLSGKENFITVAATNGSDRLSSTSSYSRELVDIAANGCAEDQEYCDANAAATSYAAPRVSRAAANLMEEFPDASPNEVKLALMLGAKIPNKMLAVRSAGVLDEAVTRKILLLIRENGMTSIKSMQKEEILSLIMTAKFGKSAFDGSENTLFFRREQIKKQMNWILNK